MSDKPSDADAVMPKRVHRLDHTAANEQLPKSIWQPGVVKRLADYIKHLREVDQQSDQPDVASQSAQPSQRHICQRDPHRSCSCPRGVCADDSESYRHARGPYLVASTDPRIPVPQSNQLGNFRCPISGKLCSEYICRDWCSGG